MRVWASWGGCSLFQFSLIEHAYAVVGDEFSGDFVPTAGAVGHLVFAVTIGAVFEGFDGLTGEEWGMSAVQFEGLGFVAGGACGGDAVSGEEDIGRGESVFVGGMLVGGAVAGGAADAGLFVLSGEFFAFEVKMAGDAVGVVGGLYGLCGGMGLSEGEDGGGSDKGEG